MSKPDLNLLYTLEALLSEGSVARAARRLRLSPSAMSRSLARLRKATGDPLLVRAGRGLVPTPRAEELRGMISGAMQQAVLTLTPQLELNLAEVDRVITFRASDGFVENFGPALVRRIAKDAPGIQLRFILKTDRDSAALRDARVDLETGVVGQETGPEIRTQALFRDRFIGVVRKGHELSRGKITPARFASAHHVAFSRRGVAKGQIDQALAAKGLERRVVTIVGGFSAALALARASDLVATVPERHTSALRSDLFSFPLPVSVPGITVSLLWHPRLDADPVHRWVRKVSRETCAGR